MSTHPVPMSSTCRLDPLCERTATEVVTHPILPDVPACKRCADSLAIARSLDI